ncbi:MAG: MerR family transcriptional regulator [Pseudolysinimonas sp.]
MSTRVEQEWSIQQLAKLAGTTSRTLRHYDEVGLVAPSRIGSNGYRYYDAGSLVRLQRVMLLRELGLGIPAIAELLRGQRDDIAALESHQHWLMAEQDRITRQLASVQDTITRVRNGGTIMADTMFDGFDHTQYKEEVEQRWGAGAYASGDRWWTSMSAAEKAQWKAQLAALQSDWVAAASSGDDPAGEAGQQLAKRQAEWLAQVPGTPGYGTGAPARAYLIGLGEMYVADPRFGKNYGGAENATFVRDALRIYAERELS